MITYITQSKSKKEKNLHLIKKGISFNHKTLHQSSLKNYNKVIEVKE